MTWTDPEHLILAVLLRRLRAATGEDQVVIDDREICAAEGSEVQAARDFARCRVTFSVRDRPRVVDAADVPDRRPRQELGPVHGPHTEWMQDGIDAALSSGLFRRAPWM